MPFVVDKQEQWSKVGLRVCVGSVAIVAILCLLDGVLRGPFTVSARDFSVAAMWMTWFTDFRYMFEQLIYVGAIVFVGAKFIETRTIFTVGFSKIDAGRVHLSGPDEENIVWIGQRYDSALEAETVASAIRARLDDKAA